LDQQLLSFHLTADFIALTWNGKKPRKEISNICQLSIPNRPIIAKVGKEDWKMEKTDDKKTIWQNMQEVFWRESPSRIPIRSRYRQSPDDSCQKLKHFFCLALSTLSNKDSI
jgi:hypothetical protein